MDTEENMNSEAKNNNGDNSLPKKNSCQERLFTVEANATEDKGSRHTMDDVWFLLQDVGLDFLGKLSSSSRPEFLLNNDDFSEESKKLSFLCSWALQSVNVGGSVLILISLQSSNLKVPIYIISSVAEELLSFLNFFLNGYASSGKRRYFGTIYLIWGLFHIYGIKYD